MNFFFSTVFGPLSSATVTHIISCCGEMPLLVEENKTKKQQLHMNAAIDGTL